MKNIILFLNSAKDKADSFAISARNKIADVMTRKHRGIDGVIVVVGLCIIALVIIFLLKDKLAEFVGSITDNMQNKSKTVLDGASMNLPTGG